MTYAAAELEALRRSAFGRCRAAGAEVDDAEDCAQEAVTALLAQPAVRHPKAWVSAVAYHRYIDLHRLRQRESAAGLLPSSGAGLATATGPEDEVVDRAQARWLVRAMDVLPASTRAVCHEVARGGSYRGIAGRLGLTDRAVESHVTRARRSLRALSLLSAAVALALGRLLRRATSTAKPLAVAGLVPSLVLALTIGGADDTSSRDRQGSTFSAEPAGSASSPAGPRPGSPPAAPPAEPAPPTTAAGLAMPPSDLTRRPGPGVTALLPDGLSLPLLPSVQPSLDLPLPATPAVPLLSAPPLPPPSSGSAASPPPLPIPPLPPLPLPPLPPLPGR
ncbi:MAG TPA: sigma-70 family RNA polymerase sigma factor [Pseudonocardiaceae bacterium]